MALFDIVLLLLASAANILLGVIAFAKNPKNISNRLFFLLTVVLVSWTVANFVSITSSNNDMVFFAVQMILALVVLQNTAYLSFVLYFPDGKLNFIRRRLFLWVYLSFSFIVFMVAAMGMLFDGYEVQGADPISPVPSPFIGLFMLHALSSTVVAIVALFRRIRNSHGSERNQLRFLILASIVLFLIVPLTNFILPIAFDITVFAPFSPVYALVFASVIAYTMIRHNLLNFGTVVARTTTYALTIVALLGIYILIGNVLPNLLLEDTDSAAKDVIIFMVALAMALAAHPLRLFFDRLTNKIFYKQGYDAQSLIDKLNQTLVTDVEVDALLEKTNSIVIENFNLARAGFYIRETSYFSSRFIATNMTKVPESDLEKIRQIMPKLKVKVYSVDNSPKSSEEKILIDIMRSNKVEVIGRLVSTTEYEVAGIGFLLLGAKKNGDPYTRQDIKVIGIIANELVLAVENALRLEEIEQFNVTLQKKIDDATKELKETNTKLRALDEAKDEFVSMASHQLRTPLTSIKGYISMVLEGDAGDITDTQKKMLGQAFFSSQRMVYLISDLLNVSRLKTGKFLIEAKPVYLPDLVADEVTQLQEGAQAKNLKLAFTKPKKFSTLKLDDMKIRQVVMNFTDNAIYYTPSGGKIAINLKETSKSVEFTVTDSGIGVPKEQQHKLFAKFYRADNARKARPDGTGLGLFMAKKVIIAQGGSIIFKSTEGKGSTFGFSFPKEKLLVDTSEKEA